MASTEMTKQIAKGGKTIGQLLDTVRPKTRLKNERNIRNSPLARPIPLFTTYLPLGECHDRVGCAILLSSLAKEFLGGYGYREGEFVNVYVFA